MLLALARKLILIFDHFLVLADFNFLFNTFKDRGGYNFEQQLFYLLQ